MKQLLASSVFAVLLAVVALPAFSQVAATANTNGEMIIGDQVVLRIHSPAGGMSVQQRIDEVTTRLNKRLGSKDFDPSLITVRKSGADYAIMYRDSLIVTVDTNTAAYNKTSTQGLANQWAANLRRVIPTAKALNEHQ